MDELIGLMPLMGAALTLLVVDERQPIARGVAMLAWVACYSVSMSEGVWSGYVAGVAGTCGAFLSFNAWWARIGWVRDRVGRR